MSAGTLQPASSSPLLPQLRLSRLQIAAVVFLLGMMALCFAAPLIAPYHYAVQDTAIGASSPSADHWLGTDEQGRDLLSRILYGGRVSFTVGLLATAVALIIGVTVGSISGYIGGKLDRLLMRTVEIVQALPFTIFVILLVVVFGRHFWLLFVAIGAVEWPTMARIVRGKVLTLRDLSFIQAARTMGQSTLGILRHHILPNILGLVVVYATLTIPSVMLLEAFISFLGLGIQAPMTSWGDLIKNGADAMEDYPWLLIFPSLAFSSTLLCLNFLGDGLRDAIDPRARNSSV